MQSLKWCPRVLFKNHSAKKSYLIFVLNMEFSYLVGLFSSIVRFSYNIQNIQDRQKPTYILGILYLKLAKKKRLDKKIRRFKNFIFFFSFFHALFNFGFQPFLKKK